MSKRANRKYGISRRLGVNLWGRDKDPFAKRNYPPGEHGGSMGYRKGSDYKIQLNAKQQLKRYYGDISEKQFRKIYQTAARRKGDTSQNMIGLLESRLDALVYRCFVPTVFAARQFVNHGHVTVNGKKVNIPSYRLKAGDVVEIKQASRNIPMILEYLNSRERPLPEYIEDMGGGIAVKYIRVPELGDVPYPVVMEPNLVTEYYSR